MAIFLARRHFPRGPQNGRQAPKVVRTGRWALGAGGSLASHLATFDPRAGTYDHLFPLPATKSPRTDTSGPIHSFIHKFFMNFGPTDCESSELSQVSPQDF